jgi:DNA-binding transcriptional LysR family regulator
MWRLSHLGSKLAFLRAGFGFGSLPLHMVEADLATGALVQIATEDAPPGGHVIAMWAVYRTDSPPGPAGRWFVDRLRQEHAPLKQAPSRAPPASIAASAARRRSSQRSLSAKRKRSR